MPSECPGEKMQGDQADRVYAGIIDFRFGQWCAAGTVMMPGFNPLPEQVPGWTIDWDDVNAYLRDHPYEHRHRWSRVLYDADEAWRNCLDCGEQKLLTPQENREMFTPPAGLDK